MKAGGELRVVELESLTPADLRGVSMIYFERKGAASHIEVICRIRGITLVDLTVSPAEEWSREDGGSRFDGSFQLSISGARDLDGIDLSKVDSVFIRVEHLLYESLWEDPHLLEAKNAAALVGDLRRQLEEVAEHLSEHITLLIRGADVRSDDPVVRLHERREANPDLGLHGASWLVRNPWWVAIESEVVSGLGVGVEYGVPFVRGTREFDLFADQFSHVLPPLVAFIETPSALSEFASNTPATVLAGVAIGLKDLAQFYFGADRGNSTIAEHLRFNDPGLLEFVGSKMSRLQHKYPKVSLFQQPDTLELYGSLIGREGWLPSMAAGSFAQMGRTNGI